MSNFINLDNVVSQINDLIDDLGTVSREIEGKSEEYAKEAAEIIASEQRRIFKKAEFKRDKPRHTYKFANESLISLSKLKLNHLVKYSVGFSTEDISAYPELIEIEFGRPGKSPRCSSKVDKIGRKKGNFPPQVMPIREGFILAKEKAYEHYAEKMLNKTEEIIRR